MPHPVDVHVGRRVKQLRWLKGMTQQQLAKEVGVKFQQVQKYETGANRVSASRLWQLCEALQVPVGFFFEDLAEEEGGKAAAGFREPDHLYERESLELVRVYYGLDAGLRRCILDLLKAIPHNGLAPSPRPRGRTAAKTGRKGADRKARKTARR